MRRLLYVAPAAVFAVVAGFLAWGLTYDPSEVPSALTDQPVPPFDLPPLDGRADGLADTDLRTGEIGVLNVFASWCVPCRAEHAQLAEIGALEGVSLYGINYKDQPEDALAWLEELGDPYRRIGADRDGRAGIDLGVYGVPETFFVGRDGAIRYKHIGPIMPDDLKKSILPLLERLRQ